jgi:glycosyltransferase involved in cell wall biosynthesis
VLVEPADAAGLASALDRLLGDPVLRRRMADAGRLRADNYRWERLCRRVLDVYGAALGARAGGPA